MTVTYNPTFGRKLVQSYDVNQYSSVGSAPALDVKYWFLQFPRPQMASAVHVDDDTLSVVCAWADCDQLISLCWSADDLYDHPLAQYTSRSDYSSNTWKFSLSFDANIPGFDSGNGITLTVVNAEGTFYVRLWNYAQAGSTGNNATFLLDFSNLRSEFAPDGPLVDTTTISQMFLTFSNTQYGNGVKLTDYQYSTVIFKQLAYTGPALEVRTPIVGDCGTQMTLGYDDLYNQTPKRLVDQMVALGYTGNCTCYIGMSHFMRLGWIAGEARFGYTLKDTPMNDASAAWLTELYTRLKAANINLIFSMSYEMFYSYVPTDWCQLDYQGNPALTGWEPPSSLMAFTRDDVMTHLKNTAAQCLSLLDANDTKYFQIGEPWWWDGTYSNGQPCFYDPTTVALFAAQNPGQTMYQFTSITEPVDTPQKQLTANWLSSQLGISTNAIAAALKAQFSNVKTCVLFFTPQAFGAQLTSIVNYPHTQWASPNFDFFQIECYDEVTAGNIEAQDQQIRTIIPQLGYSMANLQYFAGFVLYHDAAEASWPLIYDGMVDAFQIGIGNIAIWSYSQIVRDGIVMQKQKGRRSVVANVH